MSVQNVFGDRYLGNGISASVGGNIRELRFCKLVSGAIVECNTAGELVLGVSTVRRRSADAFALTTESSYQQLPGPGSIITVAAGEVLASAGVLVATDNQGRAVACTNAHPFAAGILLSPASATGDAVSVWFLPHRIRQIV